MVHSIMVEVSGESENFSSRGNLGEEIGIGRLVHAHSRCSPLKGGSSLQGPSNIQASGNIRVISSCPLFHLSRINIGMFEFVLDARLKLFSWQAQGK